MNRHEQSYRTIRRLVHVDQKDAKIYLAVLILALIVGGMIEAGF